MYNYIGYFVAITSKWKSISFVRELLEHGANPNRLSHDVVMKGFVTTPFFEAIDAFACPTGKTKYLHCILFISTYLCKTIDLEQ